MNIYLAILLLLCALYTTVSAQVRKCRADKDCRADECCSIAFYAFRCEKRGYKEGDSCGLCGCQNGLHCEPQGFRFSLLGGGGRCRWHPPSKPITEIFSVIGPSSTRLPPPVQRPVTKIKPADCSDKTTAPNSRPSSISDKGKIPGTKARPPLSGKDRFTEIFRPIYEQFVELAVSVAGITLNDTETTTEKSVV